MICDFATHMEVLEYAALSRAPDRELLCRSPTLAPTLWVLVLAPQGQAPGHILVIVKGSRGLIDLPLGHQERAMCGLRTGREPKGGSYWRAKQKLHLWMSR